MQVIKCMLWNSGSNLSFEEIIILYFGVCSNQWEWSLVPWMMTGNSMYIGSRILIEYRLSIGLCYYCIIFLKEKQVKCSPQPGDEHVNLLLPSILPLLVYPPLPFPIHQVWEKQWRRGLNKMDTPPTCCLRVSLSALWINSAFVHISMHAYSCLLLTWI